MTDIAKIASTPFESADQLIELFKGGFDIDQLEKVLLHITRYDDPDWQTIHRFSPGLYIRELQMFSGMLVLGHRQKTEQLNILLKGRVTMLSEDGTTKELKAPMMFVGPPGRKCCYVHEDAVWMNVYPTEETNIDKLEETFLDKSKYSQEFIKDFDVRKHEIITDLTEGVKICLDG